MIDVDDGYELRRLQWQCRRGMLELDILLQEFLEIKYGMLDDKQKQAFHEMLTYADQDLQAYLLGEEEPEDARIVDVIKIIRNPHSS